MPRRLGIILWGVIVLGCLLFTASRAWRGQFIDTSLLTLLPASEGDALLTETNTLLSQRASRLMAFLVGHADADIAAEMGLKLKAELQRARYVHASLTDISPEQQKAFYDVYFPFRYQMLSAGDRQRLQAPAPLTPFTSRLTSGLYGPGSAFFKNLIPADPLLLFPELARSWAEMAPPEALNEPKDGVTYVDPTGVSYAFSAVELARDPFVSKNQDAMMGWIAELRQRFSAQWPEGRFYSSGVLPFAAAERLRTEREMTWVSAAALAGVLLLAALVFSSLRILLLAALPITVGFVAASAATLLVFGKIHMITLAFGSSLIGVAIDYPLLYLAHRRMAGPAWQPLQTLRRVGPGLLIGAATAVLGYAALSLAPFPGLRQMALFSSTGLIAALLTVFAWFPALTAQASARADEPRLLTLGQRFLAALRRRWNNRHPKAALLGAAGLLLFTGFGLVRLRFDDDIRRLQRPPEAVLQEDAFVRAAVEGVGASRFILVRGSTQEELLRRQELLQERLIALRRSGVISSVQSLAPFVPSRHRQESDRRLLQQVLLANAAGLRKSFDALGLSPQVADDVLRDIRRPLDFFSVEQWLQNPVSQTLRSLWVGSTPHGYASAVLVGGLADTAALRAALRDVEGVRFFDQLEEYSNLFHRYRHYSVALMAIAYAGVWGLMMFRYGFKRGTYVTLPSLGGILVTFALLGWRGIPLHLIHCLSALLVLSMGIDYAIYFMESARAQGAPGATLLAVELCAFSTIWSFGLLALCRTPVLAAIGIVVSAGMTFAFLFSPWPAIIAGAPAPEDRA